MKACDLPIPGKDVFWMRDHLMVEPSVLLRRIQHLNLHTEDWRVLNSSAEGNTRQGIIIVDRKSADSIRAANFKAFTGIDRGLHL